MFAILATTIALSAPGLDKTDAVMLSILTAEAIYDVANTRYRLDNPEEGMEDLPTKHYFEESDPILGTHPGPLRLWSSFAVAIAAAVVVCYFLPATPRRLAEGTMVGGESVNLAHNALLPGHIVWKVSF